MAKMRGLGRGLDALLNETDNIEPTTSGATESPSMLWCPGAISRVSAWMSRRSRSLPIPFALRA